MEIEGFSMPDPESAKPMAPDRKNTAGVQSIETGTALLQVLAQGDGPMKLSDLAAAAGMSTSRAHKYLASFIRCGLVRQSHPSGRYGMGALAAELGFAALRNMDVVELAQDALDGLRDHLQTVVSLAVWANRGPTIVRRAVHEQSVSLVVQLGGVMTMLTSAGGLVFSAWLDRAVTEPLMKAELAEKRGLAARARLRTMRDVETVLEQVRAQGFASISGTQHRGIAAASTPVFDYTGKIAAALTLVGVDGTLDLEPQGHTVRALLEAAADLSRRAGASAATIPEAVTRGSHRENRRCPIPQQ
jgi:DNA-binding IclR family transcriptional regulator